MRLRLFTLLLALLLLGFSEAFCEQCASDGMFGLIQIKGYMYTFSKNGGKISAHVQWTLRQHNYQQTIRYAVNLFGESMTRCTRDGYFCIDDRLYMSSEHKMGYTLYYGGRCSNYWARFYKRFHCPIVPSTTTLCHWDMNWQLPNCN